VRIHRGPAAVFGDESHTVPFEREVGPGIESINGPVGRLEKAWRVGRSVSQKTCRFSQLFRGASVDRGVAVNVELRVERADICLRRDRHRQRTNPASPSGARRVFFLRRVGRSRGVDTTRGERGCHVGLCVAWE